MQRTSTLPRSRFGCTTCREKHRKCDEKKPICGQCKSRGHKCVYGTTLKWASPGSISSFDKALRKKKKRTRQTRPPVPAEDVEVVPSSPSSELSDCPDTGDDAAFTLPLTTESDLTRITRNISQAEQHDDLTSITLPDPSPLANPQSSPFKQNDRPSSPSNNDSAPYWAEPAESAIDPALRAAGHFRHASGATELPNYHIEDGTGSVSEGSASLHEISTPNGFSSWAVDNTLNSLLYQIFDSPNEEIAFNYFFKHVCSVIPAYDAPQNPYRKLTIVALSYPVLLHGILAVSTAYMYNHGRSHESILSLRQSRALGSLQVALNALQANKDPVGPDTPASDRTAEGGGVFSILSTKEIVLAAVTMQTASVLMSGIGVIEDHVVCALHFIQELGHFYQAPRTDFIWLFVYRFATVDVLLALLRFRRPHAPLDFFMYQANEQLDDASPSFRDMMGFSQRVLCFLAHISVLSDDMIEGTKSQAHVQAKAHNLETEMRIWGQHYYDRMIQSVQSDTTSPRTTFSQQGVLDQRIALDIVCEIHYWVAHLLLMRRVFLDPTESVRVQMVRRYMFRLMDLLPAGCGSDSCLPFPFYLAAREAIKEDDRNWVRQKHAALMDVYRHQSRVPIMNAVEDIWEKSATTDMTSFEDVPAWETPKERFIRDRDRSASYFMF